VMLVMYSEHVSDVMMISQAFTAISSRITGTTMFIKIIIASDGCRSEVLNYTILGDTALENCCRGTSRNLEQIEKVGQLNINYISNNCT